MIVAVYVDGALVGSAPVVGQVRGLAWTVGGRGILIGIERRGIELWPRTEIAG